MNLSWPTAYGEPVTSARLRSSADDFRVDEQLGFEPSGDGEHVFLHLQKRELNTADLVQRVSLISGVQDRDIGYAGLKDRNAVTSQWLSVGMAGRVEPDWSVLESDGQITVLHFTRHLRKLKRGVHRANRFRIRLREISADRKQLTSRLQLIQQSGVPNYFGRQRFGRDGSTLDQALAWVERGGRKITRRKRGLFLSALRALLFNTLLARRVQQQSWDIVEPGDVCMLRGSRSLFPYDSEDGELVRRAEAGDIHPGLPLWGCGRAVAGPQQTARWREQLESLAETCHFLEQAGLALAHRPARLIADDFCWQFCDDDCLDLEFELGPGSYATALIDELAATEEGEYRRQ